MIKQELYKLFIKNKMLLISVLFLIISTALTLVDALFISRPDGWCMEYIYVNESGINWLLIFVIMIAVRQSYVIEFESRMDSFLLTSKKGVSLDRKLRHVPQAKGQLKRTTWTIKVSRRRATSISLSPITE